MDKMQLATEIGQLEGDVSRAEGAMREQERRLTSARSNYVGGLVGLVLGVILLFLPWWYVGILLLAAGVLAAGTGLLKQMGARRGIRAAQATIDEKRAKLATLRAQLAIA